MRRELAICKQYRISHSHYLGGPPTWTQDDRDKAESYDTWLAGCCPACGTREEAWDPARGGHRDIMIAETRRCEGCLRKEEARAAVPSDVKGVHIDLIPNPRLRPGPDGWVETDDEEAQRHG